MRYALKIFSFGWKYLRNYRTRLALGLLCGFLYAFMNGGAVWVSQLMQSRFSTKTTPAMTEASPGSVIPQKPSILGDVFKPVQSRIKDAGEFLKNTAEPWLPQMGAPL